MRKNYFTFCVLLAALALFTVDADAQLRYVDVEPGVGTLNDSIAKDTLANGERNDPENTVYRLKRGNEAYYGLTGSISNKGYPLTIVAQDGDGARPFLQPRVVGDESSRAFRPKGDITLIGLHVTNLDDLGGLKTRMLRCSADDITITAEDCWFDKDGQSLIRSDNPGQSYFLTNCIISNIGHPQSLGSGRGIDDRGNDIDTIMFDNCTWYNILFGIIRDDGGTVKYASINNNTIVNVGWMGVNFGPSEKIIMTNNIVMNAGFLPMNTNRDLFMLSADSIDGVAPEVTMTNNTAYLDSAKLVPYLNDTLVYVPFINPTLALATAGSEELNENLNIVFTDGPPFNDSLLMYYYDSDYEVDNTPFWEEPTIPGVGEGGNGIYHLDVPYDFGYVNSIAYYGGTDGMQVGDRRWEASAAVGVNTQFEQSMEMSVYPMPANQQLTIDFSIEDEALVQIEVYNLTGARVANVVNAQYPAGSHSFTWSFDGTVENGMYILRMNAGGASSSTKFIVQ